MHAALEILAVIRDGAAPEAAAKLQAEVDAEWVGFEVTYRADWNYAWRSKHTRDCDLSGYEDESCECDPPDGIALSDDVQRAHRDRQRIHARRQTIEYVQARLEDGRWTAPSPYMNLVAGRRVVRERYDRIRALGAPQRVLDLFARWIARADEILSTSGGDAIETRIRLYSYTQPGRNGVLHIG